MPTKNKRRAAFRKRLTSDPPPPDEATKAKLEGMANAKRGRLAIELLRMALELPDEVLHAPIVHAEKLYPLCDHIQRYQRACRDRPKEPKP
jgi:hypothetical protein